MIQTVKKNLSLLTASAFFYAATVVLSGADERSADSALSPEIPVLPEFRSVITVGDETSYSLHHPEEGVSFWISEDEVRNGVEIVDFSAEENALTIYLDEEIHQLNLSPSRIAELAEPRPERRRRPSREERRERYRNFVATWQEATQTSETLGQLDQDLRALASEFRETRSARRRADRGTDERESLRNQERSLGREIRLLSEYTALQAAQTPAFQEQSSDETERMSRMLRGTAFRRSR